MQTTRSELSCLGQGGLCCQPSENTHRRQPRRSPRRRLRSPASLSYSRARSSECFEMIFHRIGSGVRCQRTEPSRFVPMNPGRCRSEVNRSSTTISQPSPPLPVHEKGVAGCRRESPACRRYSPRDPASCSTMTGGCRRGRGRATEIGGIGDANWTRRRSRIVDG